MKIRLSDVGRIESAEIILDGITVVAGNNGSGKSTISKSLYTVLEAFYDFENKKNRQQVRSLGTLLRKWYAQMPRDMRVVLKGLYPVRKIMKIEGLSRETFFKKVAKEFSVRESEVLNSVIEKLYVEYCNLYNQTQEQYQRYLTQLVVDGVFSGQMNTMNRMSVSRVECRGEEDYIIEVEDQFVKHVIGAEQFVQPVYITTSDLIDTVGNARKLLAAVRVDSVSYANEQLVELLMREISAKDLTMEEYERLQKQKSQVHGIFQQVLNGELRIEKRSLVYYDEWVKGNLELDNVASGVRIFLILKRLLYNGIFLKPTCLIIDEPETNLHPEWQLRLAELLVMLNKVIGINIYTNTHSPYFARAIEYYAFKHGNLDGCRFYMMKEQGDSGMYVSEDVTEKLGTIYDMLAEPFNKIM